MKKVVLALAVYSLSISGKLNGQVSLSPEIGISYWPISNRSIPPAGMVASSQIDYLFGMSGAVPVHDKWSLNVRLSYVKRETLHWSAGEFSGPLLFELKHSDLNIDLNICYLVLSNFSLCMGPSIVRKLNSTLLSYRPPNYPFPFQMHRRSLDRFMYGFNLASNISIQKLIIRAEYARFFWDQSDSDSYWRFFRGGHRYNLTLSYPVFTGKKR